MFYFEFLISLLTPSSLDLARHALTSWTTTCTASSSPSCMRTWTPRRCALAWDSVLEINSVFKNYSIQWCCSNWHLKFHSFALSSHMVMYSNDHILTVVAVRKQQTTRQYLDNMALPDAPRIDEYKSWFLMWFTKRNHGVNVTGVVLVETTSRAEVFWIWRNLVRISGPSQQQVWTLWHPSFFYCSEKVNVSGLICDLIAIRLYLFWGVRFLSLY